MAHSVTILGIPVGCNLFKFKTWLKQKFKFNSEINFRRLESNNSVELIISDVAEFTRIQQEEFDYSFGNQNFKITFICSDFLNTLTSGNSGLCPPSQHSIHLLNIPDAFNNYRPLREHFERFGQIKRIHLQKRSKTSATITYVRESDARKVISEGATLDGIPLNIIWDVDEAFALSLPTIGSVDTGSNLSFSLESLIPAGKRCLLIIPKSKNTPNLKELIQIYFASEVATGGGNIAHLQPVVDGWLLEYESETTTDRVLQRNRSISLEGHQCSIFERVIPSYYTDRIKLSGISANTAFQTQQLLLATYSRESSNKEILCSDIHWYGDHCIVLYEGNTNIDVYNLVEKIGGEVFRETPLKAELLQQTNCVEVSNITSDVNSDDLKSLFNNQRQCDNEAVTLVQRVSDDSAVVHFATHSVAEKVVRNAAMRNLTVKLCKVVVRLYYREITETNSESLETTLPTELGVTTNHPSNKADESNITLISNAQHTQLENFIFECAAHPDVLAYFNYTGQLDSIKEELECAEYIQAQESETGSSIIITPKENLAINQAEFEQSCKEFIENQLGLFNHERVTLDPATIDFLKETKSMTPTPGFTSWIFENRKAQFFFRLETDAVELTGLQEDVSKACNEMKSMKLKEDEIGFNTNHGRKFLECGCFGKIQEKYKDSLVMKFNTNPWELHIRGEQTNVTSAKLDAEHIVKNLEKCKVELEGYELKFLQNILKDRAFAHVRQKILDCLKEKGIFASISMKEDLVYLHFLPGSASGKDELKQLIAFKKLVVQNNEVLKTPHWEKYLDSWNDVLFQVMLPPDEEKMVILVGFRSELDMAKDMVLGYIDENEKLTKTVLCSYPAASYLTLYDPLSSTKLKNVKWVINFQNGGGIEISGTRKHLKEAETWISERTNSYAMITHDDHTPGFADHFRSESSEKELELIQSSNKCLILLDHNDFSYYNPDVENSLPLTSDIIKGTEVKMNVYKGNISKHRCDVVVVPAGKTLDTESNPTLTAVAKKVGDKFKQELSKKSGNLKIGEVIPIPCDHQSGFKQVVLAVVPSWRDDNNPANLLTTCVVDSLKAADECKATSVAFPALCCGNGGADLEKCISIILKGCIEYVKKHKKSTIKQLDFVEIRNNQVLQVFKREVKKHSKVVKATQSRAASAKEAVKVSTHLVTRSITNQTADVIVNSTNTETLHKVGGSKLAEAISQAAGPELQEECHKLAESQPKSGTIVETGAYNLPSKKVYHILLDPYNQNNGPSINEAIKQCLKLATKSKFTSISFPAVGCGAFGFPPTEVAKRMKEEIKKIQGHTTLENVYINLHPSDTQNIQAFRNIFGTTNPSGKSKFEHLQVTVTHGNIVTEQCDVLINSISEKADLNASGPLSKEISEQGGNVVQTQFKDMKRKHASSTMRVTDGGNLPCDVIVHGATEKIGIQQLVFKSLQIAEDLGKSSVAIPALGTGNMGRGERDSAEEIRRGIIEFDQTKPVNVKHVKVVVYQGKMLSTFQSVMSGRVNQAHSGVANVATITLNSLRLEVYQGDVTTESGDVLVNNVLQNMDITGAGPLSNAIVKVAGNSIVQEFRNNTGKHGYNHISVTAAGALSYDNIIHVGFKPHLTGERIKDALKVAEKNAKDLCGFSSDWYKWWAVCL